MLGIEINGEFLNLSEGAQLELERQNPFLQFNDQLQGDYSLPFQAMATDNNLKKLNYAAVAQRRLDNTGIDAMIYDGGQQRYRGKVKIERTGIHLNRLRQSTIDCYFLGTAASFWQDIKDKKLRDVDLGGPRSFAWAGLNTNVTGFWRHIHQVANGSVGDYDYAFYPVINKSWPEEGTYPPVMNLVYYDAMEAFQVRFPNVYAGGGIRERNRIVPFPYLKYVIERLFAHVGWQVEGDILNDPDFLKITMINFRAIDWCFVKFSGGSAIEVPRNPVVFDLKDHVPDISIASFLIALKNRFGWWLDFDTTSRKCHIKLLKDLATGAPREMTKYSSPLLQKKVLQDLPVYALRNSFATNIGSGAPDFKVASLQGAVNKTSDLPAAGESRYGHVYLVEEENNYYICRQNEISEVWFWDYFAANIYDYEPTGANNDITTEATLIGNEMHDNYLDFIPRIDNQGEWFGRTDPEEPASWGIHLAFYFGLRPNKDGDPYPFASHHIYDSQGYTLAAWSLAFKGQKTDGTQIGLYDLNWKPFLDMLSKPEEVEHTLYLPVHEYLNLKFSDRIVVDGVMLFIKQIKEAIPYKGSVTCTSIRL